MSDISLRWSRCPHGVALTRGSEGDFYRYCSDEREDVRFELRDLQQPVILAFTNALNEKAMLQFLRKFGLTTNQTGVPWEHIQAQRQEMHELLWSAAGDVPAEAAMRVNQHLLTWSGFRVTPYMDIDEQGAPRLTFRAHHLLGYMGLEAALIAEKGARAASCEHCAETFLTGPLTGGRSHAKFCRDRCRVAAMRKRNRVASM